MESLSTGCSVVASNTQPVREVIESGKEGILVDFFDTNALASRIDELIKDPAYRSILSKNARNKIVDSKYDLKNCLREQVELIEEVIQSCS